MFAGSTAPHPGSNTAAYFATHDVRLSPEEARELLSALLRLAQLGAISVEPLDECRGSSPKTPASAEVSCADSGAGGASRNRKAALRQGPTVYNMGASDYTGTTK